MERNIKIIHKLNLTAVILCSAVICLSSCGSSGVGTTYRLYSGTNSVGIATSESNMTSNVPLKGDTMCIIKDESSSLLTFSDEDFDECSHIMAVNTDSNDYLYSKDVYDTIYPASLTKLFTAYIILRDMDMNSSVTITKDGTELPDIYAKKCGLREGDVLTVDTLLHATLVTSANDAAKSLAIAHSGSEEEFCKEMNKTAASLGATHSHFSNSHGLHSEDHFTTLYDLYIVFNELIKDTRFLDIIKDDSYTMKYTDKDGDIVSKDIASTNKYLTGSVESPAFFSIFGGKTGTTDEAGCCMMLYSSDISNNHYIVAVTKAETTGDLYDSFEIVYKTIAEKMNFVQ